MAAKTLDRLNEFLGERILVVPTEALTAIGVHAGFTDDPSVLERFVDLVREKGRFVERDAAESDPELLQPIPLGYFAHDGSLLLLRRREESRRHRMHDKYAIWAGGHVRELDLNDGDPLLAGLFREIREELFVESLPTPQPVGLVLDTASPQSARHLGVVFRFDLANSDVALSMDQREFRETRGRSLSGRMLPKEDVVRHFDAMERWSQILLSSHLHATDKEVLSQLIL